MVLGGSGHHFPRSRTVDQHCETSLPHRGSDRVVSRMHIIASMAFTWSTSLMRRLYQLALLAVCAHGAHAQSLTRGTRLELLGGATFPNFTGDGSTKHRTGFTGGIGLVQPLGTGGWFFEPQVAYAMKGAKFEDIDPHTTIKLDYVDVPILLRYEFWVDADSRPFINLGAT